MLLACSVMSCMKRVRCAGSRSRSWRVSRKPETTVSGVFSSCETLAMKSRRMRATASICVMLRLISSRLFDPERDDLDRQRRSRVAQRLHDHGVGEVTGLEIADDLRLADEIEQGLARVLREIDAEMRLRARVGPFDTVRCVEDHHALGQRLDGASEPLHRRGEVALPQRARADAPKERGVRDPPRAARLRDRGVEIRIGPAAQPIELPKMESGDHAEPQREHRYRPRDAEQDSRRARRSRGSRSEGRSLRERWDSCRCGGPWRC